MVAGDLLEDPDELLADDLALRSGSVTPASFARNRSAAFTWIRGDVEVPRERLLHLLGLALTVQAVVDEHAGQLVAHRPVDEQGRDAGIDPAAERAQHLGRHRPARGSLPTCSSMMFAGVQSGSSPHPSYRNRFITSCP